VLDAIERVTIGAKQIEIRLSESVAVDGLGRTLTIPWIPPTPYQRREIVQGEGHPRSPIRPMRVRARAVFAESLRNAHRWLDDLVMDPNQTIELIAAREGKSERSIRMTLSLAFIAPPIVVAAIEGRLPRGFGAKRLMDLPMVWSHQWTALGPQGAGSDLIDSLAVTTAAYQNRDIGMPLDGSRPPFEETSVGFGKRNFCR
jgi:hypothetical protein